MKYIQLTKIIKTPVFSLQDLKLSNINVYPYQLTQWVKMGYLIRLKNGLYVFTDKKDKITNEFISFLLYQPSYISLEWALFKYSIIPDVVYNCTALTPKITRTFKNELGYFIYHHIKKEMFFGYKEIKSKNQIYLIAEPEKALIDYLYLNSSKIKNFDDIEELRFNEFEISKLNMPKIKKIARIVNHRPLDKVLELFLINYVNLRTNKRKI